MNNFILVWLLKDDNYFALNDNNLKVTGKNSQITGKI